MKRAKGVYNARDPNCTFLNTLEGEIVSYEARHTAYGFCMSLRLKGREGELWWQNQREAPIPPIPGLRIRGFYEPNSNPRSLDAIELITPDGEVYARASSHDHNFVEET